MESDEEGEKSPRCCGGADQATEDLSDEYPLTREDLRLAYQLERKFSLEEDEEDLREEVRRAHILLGGESEEEASMYAVATSRRAHTKTSDAIHKEIFPPRSLREEIHAILRKEHPRCVDKNMSFWGEESGDARSPKTQVSPSMRDAILLEDELYAKHGYVYTPYVGHVLERHPLVRACRGKLPLTLQNFELVAATQLALTDEASIMHHDMEMSFDMRGRTRECVGGMRFSIAHLGWRKKELVDLLRKANEQDWMVRSSMDSLPPLKIPRFYYADNSGGGLERGDIRDGLENAKWLANRGMLGAALEVIVAVDRSLHRNDDVKCVVPIQAVYRGLPWWGEQHDSRQEEGATLENIRGSVRRGEDHDEKYAEIYKRVVLKRHVRGMGKHPYLAKEYYLTMIRWLYRTKDIIEAPVDELYTPKEMALGTSAKDARALRTATRWPEIKEEDIAAFIMRPGSKWLDRKVSEETREGMVYEYDVRMEREFSSFMVVSEEDDTVACALISCKSYEEVAAMSDKRRKAWIFFFRKIAWDAKL